MESYHGSFRGRKTAFNKPEMKAEIKEGEAAAEARSSDKTALIYALQVYSLHQEGEPSNSAKIYSQRSAGLIAPGGALDTHKHTASHGWIQESVTMKFHHRIKTSVLNTLTFDWDRNCESRHYIKDEIWHLIRIEMIRLPLWKISWLGQRSPVLTEHSLFIELLCCCFFTQGSFQDTNWMKTEEKSVLLMSVGALNDKSYHNRDKKAHTICRSILTPLVNAFITTCVVCLSYCVITSVFSLGSVVYQVIAIKDGICPTLSLCMLHFCPSSKRPARKKGPNYHWNFN